MSECTANISVTKREATNRWRLTEERGRREGGERERGPINAFFLFNKNQVT
ncbi:hypothetical protein HanHA89_Chr12g0464021 [Helianthus annuus]|nr:hypothetical protein HanHA89_Chr12g0464021 [Helianthus annuus]